MKCWIPTRPNHQKVKKTKQNKSLGLIEFQSEKASGWGNLLMWLPWRKHWVIAVENSCPGHPLPLFPLSIRQILCHRLSQHLPRIADTSRLPPAASRFYQKLIWQTTQTKLGLLSPFRSWVCSIQSSIQSVCALRKSSTKGIRIWSRLSHSILQGNQKCDDRLCIHVCISWLMERGVGIQIDNAFGGAFSLSRRTQAPCQVSVMKR